MFFRPTDRQAALAALTAAGILFGLTVPLSKVALGWLDPAWLAAVRFGLAAPLLALVARRALRAAASRPVLLWGAFGYGGMVLLQNYGVERTSVSHAALIFGAVPALVALVSAATGRGAAGPLAWTGFAAALAGVALVAGAGGDASLAGDGLVLASALLSAAFVVAQSRLLGDRDPVAVTALQLGSAAVLCTGVAVAGPLPDAAASPQQLGAVAALVVAGSLLPFALYTYGQARVAPELAGAFFNLEPLVGALAGVVAFGNPMGPVQAAGAAAIVAGLVLSLERPRRRDRACSA